MIPSLMVGFIGVTVDLLKASILNHGPQENKNQFTKISKFPENSTFVLLFCENSCYNTGLLLSFGVRNR